MTPNKPPLPAPGPGGADHPRPNPMVCRIKPRRRQVCLTAPPALPQPRGFGQDDEGALRWPAAPSKAAAPAIRQGPCPCIMRLRQCPCRPSQPRCRHSLPEAAECYQSWSNRYRFLNYSRSLLFDLDRMDLFKRAYNALAHHMPQFGGHTGRIHPRTAKRDSRGFVGFGLSVK
jgi:hypothetical protein